MGKLKQVIEHYGHELDSSNKLCCPFHNENTPSNTYYEDTDSSYCYGCSAGGNAINWICNEEGWDSNSGEFRKAVKKYEDITGDVETYALPKTIEELEQERIKMALPFNKEVLAELKAKCTFDSGGYRGIRSDVSKQFGVMFTKNSNGDLHEVYYPTSKDSVGGKLNLTGFKVRQLPKTFNKHYGETGGGVELFGQWRANPVDNSTLILCSGENDVLAAQQMLNDNSIAYNKKNNSDFKPPYCVSSTVGENGLMKQIQQNFDFVNSFDKIYFIPDQDETGRKVTQQLLDVIPLQKLYIMTLTAKDPHKMLEDGQQRQFINCFFKAKPFTPDGVKSASDAFDEIEDELDVEGITLPDYMWRMQEMMGGSLRQGTINSVIAFTSVGKSAHVDRMVNHFILTSPVVPTVISTEATASQYMLNQLSIYLKKNLRWQMTDDEIKEWIKTDEGKRVRNELCFKEDGSNSFYVIDDRQCSIKDLEIQMENLFYKHSCRLFVIDILSDLLRGTSEEHSQDHMAWQRKMTKNGCTFINCQHTRKPSKGADGKEAQASEYDVLGTGAFVQSASVNIVLNRDKLSEDDITRNTTSVSLSKCRGGKTGDAGGWFFDFNTATCYDSEDPYVEEKRKQLQGKINSTSF